MGNICFNLIAQNFSNVSRETLERLELYIGFFHKWNSKINLISQHHTEEDLITRHLLDSLQLTELITDKNALITDLGSGGGFPGLILAISGYNCNLVESNTKKSIFLKEVALKLNLSTQVFNQRFDSMRGYKSDYIVSRAVGNINYLLTESQEIVSSNTICFFHKSERQMEELKDLKKFWSFDHQIYQNKFDPEGKIIKIYNLSQWRK